jgi:hypothetical protein
MVQAYWEGFKLGEQDLQVLIQGQRQLNSAQLDLVGNEKSMATDYFKLLANTGELLKYFRLDVNADNFIDFTQSNYKKLINRSTFKKDTEDLNIFDDNTANKEIKNTEDVNITKDFDENIAELLDLNTTIKIDENTTENIATNVNQNDSLRDLLNFETKFLDTEEDKWTIRYFYFDKVYVALDFAKENNISQNIFVFDTLVDNKIKSNVAYNIFDTEQLAQENLDDLNITKINSNIFTIKDIKAMDKSFKNKKLQTKRKIIKPQPFETNKEFKKKFLEASKKYYTINITSFASFEKAKVFVEKEKIYKNSFIFYYGEEKEFVKVVYGIFKTYEEALNTLNKFESIKKKYQPVIEKIDSKQELFKKYINSNKLDPIIIKDKIIEKEKVIEEVNSLDFKEVFLNASENDYTINLATLPDLTAAKKFQSRHDSALELFIFKFGKDITYYKVMSGVYKTKEDAIVAVSNLTKQLKRNKPTIESVGLKQKLYLKYNSKQVDK